MDLTITLSEENAATIYNLAWSGHRKGVDTMRANGLSDNHIWAEMRADKRLLEAFRAECESAKGGKL